VTDRCAGLVPSQTNGRHLGAEVAVIAASTDGGAANATHIMPVCSVPTLRCHCLFKLLVNGVCLVCWCVRYDSELLCPLTLFLFIKKITVLHRSLNFAKTQNISVHTVG